MVRVPGVLVVTLLLLAVQLNAPDSGPSALTGPSQQVSNAEKMLGAASSSLASGAGPASGHALSCVSIGTLSMGCAGASPSNRPANGSIGWNNLCALDSCPPPARGGAGMAFDPMTGYVVLFGGIIDMTTNPNTTLSDTWIFENSAWKHLNITGPCARLGEYMAYDFTDNYILLFGGGPYLTLNSSLYYQDTWEFQNGTWTKLFPAVHPNARGLGAITYDPLDNYLLVYGGMSSQTDIHNDTWTFSFGQWHNLTLSTHPRQLLSPVMAYDPAQHYVLLFGGATPCPGLDFGNDLQETWSYAHGIWTNLTSKIRGQVPNGRILSSMAYDPAQGYMILFGGWNTTQGVVYGDTWMFTNGFWARLFVSPAPASAIIGADLISTTSSSGLLLFGGIVGSLSNYEATNATWFFGPLPPNVRPVPFTVSFLVAPSNCAPVSFNGSAESNGLTVSVPPGPYNVSTQTCPGYVFSGWFQSGGVYVTAQTASSTTVDVTGNGSLTAYYQLTSSVSTTFSPTYTGLAVAGLCALLVALVWGYPRITRRSRIPEPAFPN